jgi:hypothetical protein
VDRVSRPGLTTDRPARGDRTRRRGPVENATYTAFCARLIRAAGRRIADGDVEGLPNLARLADDLDPALTSPCADPREFGYSWADIAARTAPPAKPHNAGATRHSGGKAESCYGFARGGGTRFTGGSSRAAGWHRAQRRRAASRASGRGRSSSYASSGSTDQEPPPSCAPRAGQHCPCDSLLHACLALDLRLPYSPFLGVGEPPQGVTGENPGRLSHDWTREALSRLDAAAATDQPPGQAAQRTTGQSGVVLCPRGVPGRRTVPLTPT